MSAANARALPQDRVVAAVEAAASGGYVRALAELLARLPDGEEIGYAAWISAFGGHTEALMLLRDGGADLSYNNVIKNNRFYRTDYLKNTWTPILLYKKPLTHFSNPNPFQLIRL